MQFHELETPCFIIKTEEFDNNILEFKKALDTFYKDNILSYSVKTNGLLFLLQETKKQGCYAEVVSYDEYALAKKAGFLISEIIYNGPMKDKETFTEALVNGAHVNIETYREIEWLKDIKPMANMHLGIRININLSRIMGEDSVDSGESRFGFSYEDGELQCAVQMIREAGHQIVGIHAHRTSKSRSLNVYENICFYIKKIISALKIKAEYIDIGGGYFGNMPGKPSYYEYVQCIHKALGKECETATLIVEPGNALIASPIQYLLEIIDTKKIEDTVICLSNGSRNDVDPLFHKTDYLKKIYSKSKREVVSRQCITGCTCLEFDRLFTLREHQELIPGDRILFDCVGAYTMTLSPNFIRLLPNIYMVEQDEYHLVRRKWTVNEWTQGNMEENNE